MSNDINKPLNQKFHFEQKSYQNLTNSRTTDSSLKILVRIFKQIFQIKNQEKRCILQHETDLTFS